MRTASSPARPCRYTPSRPPASGFPGEQAADHPLRRRRSPRHGRGPWLTIGPERRDGGFLQHTTPRPAHPGGGAPDDSTRPICPARRAISRDGASDRLPFRKRSASGYSARMFSPSASNTTGHGNVSSTPRSRSLAGKTSAGTHGSGEPVDPFRQDQALSRQTSRRHQPSLASASVTLAARIGSCPAGTATVEAPRRCGDPPFPPEQRHRASAAADRQQMSVRPLWTSGAGTQPFPPPRDR